MTDGQEEERSPFEGVDTEDPVAVEQAVMRITIEEWLKNPPPPPPKDKAEAQRLFEEKRRAYKARMLERGLDIDDLAGFRQKKRAEYKALAARIRAAQSAS